MNLYLNDELIQHIYYQERKVDKIYLDGELIWEATPITETPVNERETK